MCKLHDQCQPLALGGHCILADCQPGGEQHKGYAGQHDHRVDHAAGGVNAVDEHDEEEADEELQRG